MVKRTFDKIATDVLNGHKVNMPPETKAIIQDVIDALWAKKVLRLERSLEDNFDAFQRFIGPGGMAGFATWLQMEVMKESAEHPSPSRRKKT